MIPPPRELPAPFALVRAIAAMQGRAWFNGLRRGFSSDPVPAAMGIAMAASSALVSAGLGAGMFVLTAFTVTDSSSHDFWITTGLLFSVTMVSTLSGISGESGDLAEARKLQVFPIRKRHLVALDLLAELFAPTLLFFLPAMIGLGFGLAVAQVRAGQVWGVVAVPAVLAGLVVTAAIVRTIAGLVVIGGRRTREILALTITGLFMSLALLGPAAEEQRFDRILEAASIAETIVRFTHAGAAASLATPESVLGALRDMVVLGAWLAGILAAHSRVTRRVLRGDAGRQLVKQNATRREARGVVGWILAGPVGASLLADVRTLTRVPTMWILMVIPAFFGLAMGRPTHSAGSTEEAELATSWMPMMAAIGAHLLFTSQLFSNLFGTDHGGVAHYVLAPVRAWKILLGKSLARLLFGIGQMTIFLGALRLRLGADANEGLLMGFLAWVAAATWVAAAGAVVSIRLPYRMSHGITRERSTRAMNSLLGQMLVAAILVPPAMIMVGGRAFGGDSGYRLGIAVTAAAGSLLWVIAATLCSEWWADRGPALVEDLSKSG